MAIITPLVNKTKRGTLVTFQSSGEDLTFTFDSSIKKFKFSKFALLDLPAIVTSSDNLNTMQFGNIEGAFVTGLSTDSPPPAGDITDLAQSLQNYLLNLETLLLKEENYDSSTNLNVAERAFWKWLKELGAVRFRIPDASEKASTVLTTDRFVEETDNTDSGVGDLYNRVVKYIGDIDMEGNHKSNANSFKEVYVYVPTDNGNTPTVIFKTVSDENYKEDMILKQTPGSEYIVGRDATDDPTSAGLTVQAFYDMDVPLGTLTYVVNGGVDSIWFNALSAGGPDAYFTDSNFEDPSNDEIVRTDPISSNTITYKRSKLDGICLDFDVNSYKYFELNQSSKNFAEYNSSAASDSFKFNTILLYYDLLDKDGNVLATNLYGILFINDIENLSSGGSKIKSFDKIKPNSIISEQGNGYGIKINLKFDTNVDQPTPEIEVSVNDYNTFSMFLFTETMQRIALANKNFESIILSQLQTNQKLQYIESLLLTSPNAQKLLIELEQIKLQLKDYVPNADLLGLLNKNTEKINEILKGNTTVSLDFFLDIISKDGLKAKMIGSQLYLNNTRQRYAKSDKINLNLTPSNGLAKYNEIKLDEFDNLTYHKNDGNSKIAQADCFIYINDKDFQWKTNQSYTILIGDDIDMNGKGFIIYTDSINRFGLDDVYKKLIGTISGAQINSTKPRIEIICIDEINYEFLVTIQ